MIGRRSQRPSVAPHRVCVRPRLRIGAPSAQVQRVGFRCLHVRRLLPIALLLSLAVAAPASAKTKRVSWFVNAHGSNRILDQIGFIPVNGFVKERAAIRVKLGTTTYVINWVNSTAGRRSTTQALKTASVYAKYRRADTLVFTDRKLTRAEARRWKVLLDLGHSVRGGFPVLLVQHRRHSPSRVYARTVKAYVKVLRTPRFRELFRRAGVIPPGEPLDAPTTDPQASAGPTRDHAGRPITTRRNDAAARSLIEGLRLTGPSVNWAFDAPNAIVRTVTDADGFCVESSGVWELVEGWTFPEGGGGGVIAHLRITTGSDAPTDTWLELPGDAQDTAYLDGAAYGRNSDGAAHTCS